MPNRDVTAICETAGKAAAQAICSAFGDHGPSTFSVPLSTSAGVTSRALATHWGMSGPMPEEEAAALQVSLSPKVWLFDLNPQGGAPQSFDEHLAMTTPTRLYRVIEEL